MARRWGYMKKGIPENEAIIVCCKENFHGRTIAIISMSTDPDSYGQFGPFLPGIIQIDYNSVDQLKEVLEKHGEKVCCFLVEPMQGEAGVVVPDEGYLKGCYELCKKHQVLMICDEIQTGLLLFFSFLRKKILLMEFFFFKNKVLQELERCCVMNGMASRLMLFFLEKHFLVVFCQFHVFFLQAKS